MSWGLTSMLPLVGFGVAGAAMVQCASGAGQAPPADRGPWETATWSALAAVALWTATHWVLALLHLLAKGPLVGASLLAGAAGTVVLARTFEAGALRRTLSGPLVGWVLVFLAVLLSFLSYVCWRGSLMPVSGNDALSYHLPRALLLAREHGYRIFASNDFRLSTWPANYELMLADALLLDGDDRHVAGLSALCFCLYVTASAALAERWGPRGPSSGYAILAVSALAASAPVALLHAGAIKNDLLATFLFLIAFLGAGRLMSRPSLGMLLGTWVAVALALGTKLNAAMLAGTVGPVVLVAGWARTRGKPGMRVLGVLAAAALVLVSGGIVYVLNLVQFGRPLGVPQVASGGYGDWNNLWMLPLLLFKAPFSSTPDAVWAPWSHSFWFWQTYDVYSSHFGRLVTVLCCLLPLGAWTLHRAGGAEAKERRWGSLLALATFVLILPTHLAPLGFFCTFVRFLLFVVPVIGTWTLAPAILVTGKGRSGTWIGGALAGICTVVFASNAFASIQRDVQTPLSRVEACSEHHQCQPRFSGGRACFVLRKLARQRDVVALDSDFDSWIYPCFGGLDGRTVLPLGVREGDAIPEAAQWVVVDRMDGITWGHPGFVDFGHFFEFVGKGVPSDRELSVYRRLETDARFERVFDDRAENQAIFHRRSAPLPPSGGGPRE